MSLENEIAAIPGNPQIKRALFNLFNLIRDVTDPAATVAPVGGTGATGGAYDTAGNRDLMITAQNETKDIANSLRTKLNSLNQ